MGYLTQVADYLRNTWASIELKTLLLLFGAAWGLYQLLQRGALHPLLDLKVSGKFIRIAGCDYLLCSMEIKNVHLPMVPIQYSAVRLSLTIDSNNPQVPVRWKRLATFPVFQGHDKVWSGETIRDKILLVAPANENLFHVEFRIGRRYRWYQRFYKWLTGRSSWWSVVIVKRELEEKAGGK